MNYIKCSLNLLIVRNRINAIFFRFLDDMTKVNIFIVPETQLPSLNRFKITS